MYIQDKNDYLNKIKSKKKENKEKIFKKNVIQFLCTKPICM